MGSLDDEAPPPDGEAQALSGEVRIPAKRLTNIAFPLQDADLARELARLGHGRLRRIRSYTDIAPALARCSPAKPRSYSCPLS